MPEVRPPSHFIRLREMEVLATCQDEPAHWGEPASISLVFRNLSTREVHVCSIRAALVQDSEASPPTTLWAGSAGVEVGATWQTTVQVPIPEPYGLRPVAVDVEVNLDTGRMGRQRIHHLDVIPSRRFTDLAQTLCDVSGMQVERWGTIGWGDGVRALLRPDASRSEAVPALELHAYPQGPYLYGTLIIDPPARTLQGRLRASVALDRRLVAFRLPAGDRKRAKEFFQAALRPDLDPAGTLPLPAAGPTGGPENLPIPSGRPGPSPR